MTERDQQTDLCHIRIKITTVEQPGCPMLPRSTQKSSKNFLHCYSNWCRVFAH